MTLPKITEAKDESISERPIFKSEAWWICTRRDLTVDYWRFRGTLGKLYIVASQNITLYIAASMTCSNPTEAWCVKTEGAD
jgi:hypothetical protein